MKKDRYQQLTADLTEAVAAAKEVANGPDGGTCNFDSLLLHLPRWNNDKIEEAAREAGIRAWDTSYCGTKHYIFTPPVPRQGDARTDQAEAMCRVMKEKGYAAGVYYQMD